MSTYSISSVTSDVISETSYTQLSETHIMRDSTVDGPKSSTLIGRELFNLKRKFNFDGSFVSSIDQESTEFDISEINFDTTCFLDETKYELDETGQITDASDQISDKTKIISHNTKTIAKDITEKSTEELPKHVKLLNRLSDYYVRRIPELPPIEYSAARIIEGVSKQAGAFNGNKVIYHKKLVRNKKLTQVRPEYWPQREKKLRNYKIPEKNMTKNYSNYENNILEIHDIRTVLINNPNTSSTNKLKDNCRVNQPNINISSSTTTDFYNTKIKSNDYLTAIDVVNGNSDAMYETCHLATPLKVDMISQESELNFLTLSESSLPVAIQSTLEDSNFFSCSRYCKEKELASYISMDGFVNKKYNSTRISSKELKTCWCKLGEVLEADYLLSTNITEASRASAVNWMVKLDEYAGGSCHILESAVHLLDAVIVCGANKNSLDTYAGAVYWLAAEMISINVPSAMLIARHSNGKFTSGQLIQTKMKLLKMYGKPLKPKVPSNYIAELSLRTASSTQVTEVAHYLCTCALLHSKLSSKAPESIANAAFTISKCAVQYKKGFIQRSHTTLENDLIQVARCVSKPACAYREPFLAYSTIKHYQASLLLTNVLYGQ